MSDAQDFYNLQTAIAHLEKTIRNLTYATPKLQLIVDEASAREIESLKRRYLGGEPSTTRKIANIHNTEIFAPKR